METISLREYLVELKFDYKPFVERCIEIGDKTAVRRSKIDGSLVRANYERGILLTALAHYIEAKEFLEIGTGRGFTTGCVAEFCPFVKTIVTVDIQSAEEAKSLLKECKVDTSRIQFVSANSKSDWSYEYSRGCFKLFYIDGEHTDVGVRNDMEHVLALRWPKSMVVFDDFSDKFAEMKKEIESFAQKGFFTNIKAIITDGEIFGGEKSDRLMVVGDNGFDKPFFKFLNQK